MIQPALESTSGIYEHAKKNDCSLVESAAWLGSQLIKNPEIWDEPIIDDTQDERVSANLFIDGYQNLLTYLAMEISERIQFPRSTILLHSLGVVASAMCKSFKIDYDGDIYPVTLYCVTAQPPSTGKSGVNNYLTRPIQSAYNELNRENRKKRTLIEHEIKSLSKEIDKDTGSDEAIMAKLDALDELETELANCPIWNPFFTQATIEALDEAASKQTGMFNICSAEAESMTVVLGNIYSDDKSSKNYGLILSAWDGERVSGGRVSRDSTIGEVRGCIAVIAQDESVRAVLGAAESRGVSERFLLLAESDNLGKRDHSKRYQINPGTMAAYEKMIRNVILEEEVTLSLSKESIAYLQAAKQAIEPELGDGGKFSTNLLRGVMGKADKQIIKIASVLHAVDAWQDGGTRSTVIDHKCVEWALELYDILSDTYIKTADAVSHSGEKTEVKTVIECLIRAAEKGKLKMSNRALYDTVKNLKCFSGRKKLMQHIKEKIIPKLEDNNICTFDGKSIYINPRLK